jgi:prepilin-type N-terminal cleavage/methylation domain-containing protein
MRGFTLVELMVALCVGSLAIAGGLFGLSRVLESWRVAQANERLHERALYVLATLEPELQMAGFFGAGSAPAWASLASPPVSLDSCGPSVLDLSSGLEAGTGNWPLDCAAQGGGFVDGSTVLLVRRVSANPGAPQPGRVQLVDSESIPAQRQLRWDGQAPDGGAPPDLVWRDLLLRAYYVSRSADGDPATPALRVKSLTAVAGRPSFVDTEVMPGVAGLSVELLPSTAQASAARVTLIVQADQADSAPTRTPARLTVTRTFGLRNAPQG